MRSVERKGLGLDGVTIALHGKLLAALDAHVARGQVLTVMGPSGSGKSTLLAFILGVLDPVFEASGIIRLDGREIQDLPPHARHVAMLFQDDLLFPHLNVAQNLAFALPATVRGRARRRSVIETALRDVGLQGFADRDPATLSGGQRQRVALQRALLSDPGAILLDEPFSRLDSALRGEMREHVFSLIRARGLPAILVTHDDADASAAGGPVTHLDRGPE